MYVYLLRKLKNCCIYNYTPIISFAPNVRLLNGPTPGLAKGLGVNFLIHGLMVLVTIKNYMYIYYVLYPLTVFG